MAVSKTWTGAFALALFGAAAAQEPAAPTGPLSYWRLDETTGASAANQVAGAPAAAYQNAPIPSATIPALSYNNNPNPTPQSIQLNGSNQGLTVADFGAFTSFTVSTWIQRTGTTGGRESIVSYKESGNRGFVLCLNEANPNFYPRIWVNINGAWQNAEQAVAVDTGSWVHLAASYDGTTIRLYRDGGEVATGNFAGTMSNGAGTTTAIGMRNSNDQHWFPGLIDDVRLYGRALSAGEISVLAAGVPAPTALVATAGVNQVSLAWAAAAPPAVGTVTYSYHVKRRLAGIGAYATIQAAQPTTSYTDTTAILGTAYDYAVTAVSAAESGLSNTQLNLVPIAPPPRTNDHEEGLLGESCSCGATATGPVPLLSGLLALLVLMAARRR